MKFAPWIAGASLVAVVLALSTAKAISPPEKSARLDISGIDTLEVTSNRGIDIEIRSDKPARVEYADSTKSQVRVRRDGNRLVIDGQMEGYGEMAIAVPSSVHRFVLRSGTVHTKEKLAEVEIFVNDSVNWDGKAERLVMRDIKDRTPRRACGCNNAKINFNVAGTIGEAYFYSPNADLKLDAPDDIGPVYAWLGKDGTIALEGARRFDHIHLVDSENEMPHLGELKAAP
jgi:hypothetical protein